MVNKKKPSRPISKLASKTLRTKSSSKTAKMLAGSSLSQTKSKNQTGKKLEKLASNVLKSSKYNSETKRLAGSVLSQSNKSR